MTRRMNWWTVPYLALLVVAFPIAAYHLSHGFYSQALFTVGAAGVGIVAIVTDWFGVRSAQSSAQRTLIETVPAPFTPVTVSVVDTRGSCPLGFSLGQTWSINQQGQVRPALCHPAIAAATAELASLSQRAELQSRCQCPWANATLTFGVKQASAA